MNAIAVKQKPPQSIHQALRLASTYRVHIKVEGYINHTSTSAEHVALRVMHSPTLGVETVYAISRSWGPWQEIQPSMFTTIASEVIGGRTPKMLATASLLPNPDSV